MNGYLRRNLTALALASAALLAILATPMLSGQAHASQRGKRPSQRHKHTGKRRGHGKKHHAQPHKAYPLKMIWGPFTMPDGASAFPVYHQLGVQVLETQLSWASTAPQRPADPTNPADPSYQWPAALAQAISQAAHYHIQMAVMVRGSPAWSNGGRDPSWAPEDANDYANFVAAASRRYPSVRYWMIWGEPERPGNFNPMPENSPVGPQRYALLLDAAYGALKSVNPANIVIGGMTYTIGLDSPSDFIRWMRLPNGQPPRLDYFGHNPYSTRFPKLSEGLYEAKVRDINDIDTLHSELASTYSGRPGGPPKLWLSEFSILKRPYRSRVLVLRQPPAASRLGHRRLQARGLRELRRGPRLV